MPARTPLHMFSSFGRNADTNAIVMNECDGLDHCYCVCCIIFVWILSNEDLINMLFFFYFHIVINAILQQFSPSKHLSESRCKKSE